MNKNKEDFLAEVMNELNTIKNVATEKEISRLDFSKFRHTSAHSCIYGQMTGSCFSPRANKIYEKTYNEIVLFSGNYKQFDEQNFNKGYCYTALEKYLYMVANEDGTKSEMHENIIKYLKGEIDKINLI